MGSDCRPCPKCEEDTPRSPSGRCRPCEAKRARERRRKARSDFSEHSGNDAPPGYIVQGVSTLKDASGEVRLQWQKTSLDRDARAQAVRDAFDELSSDISPLAEVPKPQRTDSDLLAVYPMGDPHLGMYAWKPEAGDSFDLEIAERNLMAAVDRLFAIAPDAEEALIINLGDFFHANDHKAVTPGNGHRLDVDSRFPKVFNLGVAICSRITERALEKHDRVTWRHEPGNHDPEAAYALAACMGQRFRDNDRVTINLPAGKHWYHRFGKCLIGSTHGDRGKHKDLIELMAADRPEDWGETMHRRWYVGHVHHESTIEGRGCTVETFRTLAPSDAWHAASQYRSGRDMRCHVWHREFGLEDILITGIRRIET